MRLHRHMALVRGRVGSINLHRSGGESPVKVTDVFVGRVFRRLTDGLFLVRQGVSSFITAIVRLHQRGRRSRLFEGLGHYQRNGLMIVLNSGAA